jgi:putative phosphoesterase
MRWPFLLRKKRPDIYSDFIFFNGGTRYCSVFLSPDFHWNMTRQETSKETLRIFVLADTHNRLPETVKEIAKDADEIWHLGDLCIESILDELRAIGPRVTLVRGNCDSNFDWPLVVDLARGGLKFRLQHVPPNQSPNDIDVLLHGHTHVPRNERGGSVLFLNPGCVTRPNRGSPPSVAWLEIVDGKINWRLVPLR